MASPLFVPYVHIVQQLFVGVNYDTKLKKRIITKACSPDREPQPVFSLEHPVAAADAGRYAGNRQNKEY